MKYEDNNSHDSSEDNHHNSLSYPNNAYLQQTDHNDEYTYYEPSPLQDSNYRNENDDNFSSNPVTHDADLNYNPNNSFTDVSKYSKSSSFDRIGSAGSLDDADVKSVDAIDEASPSYTKKNLDPKPNSVSSTFSEMSDLNDLRSKSVSNRSESLKSHFSTKSHESSDRSKKKSSRKPEKVGTSENPIDITEMTVDCGSLLELYQNEYFDAFMHMYHLYHKKEHGVHEFLVNMLYTKRTEEEIGFYLPQLCQLAISKYGQSSLHRFLLDKASMSMHFALQLSWFYQAAIDDQIPKCDSLTEKMTQDTEMAAVNSKQISPASLSRPTPDVRDTEKMTFPCLLDRRLILESYSQRNRSGDVNSHEWCTSVDSLLTPQLPTSLVHNTFNLSSSFSKVKLKGVHTLLGDPLHWQTHPILEYTEDLLLDLKRLMMKQRRLNYFNILNNFVVLCMENSARLTTETKREAREPLLRVFVSALNEWMLLRRATVAAYEESFAYTGLSLPFQYLNKPEKELKSPSNMDQAFSQILRIVESETKIFFSKKRAPFVLYVEMANLDEDIEYILQNDTSSENFSMKNLYVFDSIVQDLLNYDLLTQTQLDTIRNPLECIRFALDMLPEESLDRYKNMFDSQTHRPEDSDLNSGATPYHSGNVTRSNSIGVDAYDNTAGEVSDAELNESMSPHNLSAVHHTPNQADAKDHARLTHDMSKLNVDGARPTSDVSRANGHALDSHDSVESVKVNGDAKESTESPKESPKDKDSKGPNIKTLTPDEVKQMFSKETFESRKDRIRKASPYGNLKSWDLCAFVVKGNDDLRQEKMANQVLESFKRIFAKAGLPLWLRPIEILVTGSNSGIMEFLHDTYSVDVIKKKFNSESLAPVFEKLFHPNVFEARKNFIESHAAYSIVAYLLQVKDRHNGNILLDPQGHVIHIDYGFCLSNFPGKIISFETTPFKLTKEYVDVIGGVHSDNFIYFKTLVIKGLLEARKHVDEIVLLVEMMTTANKMPCFLAGTANTIEMFKDRFMLNQPEESVIRKITEMIDASVNSFSTVQYDNFQRLTNGIM